jgi:poly(3-hydroxybutyrate) depolymerase
MRQSTSIAIVLTAFGAASAAPLSTAQSPAEFAQTAAFAAAQQNKDGGFAAKAGGSSSLGSTNTGLRVLRHVGGSVPDILACVRYVNSCRTADGGFSATPGGKSEFMTTAVGLLAASELKISDPKMIRGAVAYLGRHAQSFEEVRMAAAGLEAIGVASPDIPRWFTQIQDMRNPDGTFGAGPNQAFLTGGATAAILRFGMRLDRRDAIVAAIKAGQRPEGGWSKDDGPPDLSSSYRVMRAMYMLHERPDIDRLMAFVASCRKPDGSYSSTPGGAGDLGGTYLGTILIHWSRQLLGLPAVVETAGFTPLVNGDLAGWEGDTQLWSARDGVLIGRSPGLDHNEFLATTRSFGDFILSVNFQMRDGKGNSGVQFRSVRVPPHEMKGYQADLGEGYWGALYDESRRNMVLVYPRSEAIRTLHRPDWNRYVIRAMGDRITLTLNGQDSVRDYHETDSGIDRSGLLAVQMHAGGPMEIQFRDLMIQALPTPSADNPTQPGFHLRTVKTDQGDRRYTVYVPEGYDGSKAFPVILFLHGAGERGDDGITPAQVGLGPAILNRQGGIPAIVVFPQARRTWAAGSPDSNAALKALDDVLGAYKTEPNRVILTGLSMGGHGSWDLATARPERFVAVVPICGPGEPEAVDRLKTLPIWTFCGDADRDETVLNLRNMVEALRHEGAVARLTEYRGVGHNSWDRAYNSPELIDWMLAQRRP